MTIRGFKVHADDNVATLLDDAVAGASVQVFSTGEVQAVEAIAQGHKIALGDIAAGKAIVKFGVVIGRASREIRRGEWVHLHNCESNFDTRSQTLDVHSGATTDTRYE